MDTEVVLLDPAGKAVSMVLSLNTPSLSALLRDVYQTIGLQTRLLHDGGLFMNHPVGPVVLESITDLPPDLGKPCRWQPPENARPWQQPGWLSKVTGWLQNQLEAHGATLLSEAEQVSSYDLACVLKVETSQGRLYFKAGHRTREAVVTVALAQQYPTGTPKVLAWNAQEDWLLTQDGSPRLSESAKLEDWLEATRQLARIARMDQRLLQHLGCPSYPFADLPAQAEVLLQDKNALQAWGLAMEKIVLLRAAIPKIQQAHQQIAALDLKEVVAHGDAQPMNALVGKGHVWFDWSEASMAHPLTDVGWFLAWLGHRSRSNFPIRQSYPNLVQQLWSVYVEELNMLGVQPLMHEVMVIAMVHRALVYHHKYANWQGTLPGWRPQYVPYYLKLLLRLLDQTTSSG